MQKCVHFKEYTTFLYLLRQNREKGGRSQVEVSIRFRIDQSAYSKCERGERRMDVIELWSWCGVVDVSSREFMALLERAIGSPRA